MSFAIAYSRAQVGIKAPLATIETHVSGGLPRFTIVGLPETAVKESRDRVRSAIINSQFNFPSRRITTNLAPADLPKEGGRFDLPIAISLLAALKQIPDELSQYEFAGELALSGGLRPIKGILPLAIACQKAGRSLIVPRENAQQANLIEGLTVLAADHLLEVCGHLTGKQILTPLIFENTHFITPETLDLIDVRGQQQARRALEIAAAGGHSLIFMGPPGTGKTMLAARLASILPELSIDEALEIAALQSISHRGFELAQWRQRPFRAPHHTASSAALVGGGNPPRPGEISLAHHGVLFLDELPEYNRHVLEALREPLESKMITISRAAHQADYPANFQLIAAMNPCPCGYLGDPKKACRCTSEQVQRYRGRLSGPLLDRIDLHLEVPALAKHYLIDNKQASESSAEVKQRVLPARDRQQKRQQQLNAQLSNQALNEVCPLDKNLQIWLYNTIEQLNLSNRAYHRILKVARTIADLENKEKISQENLSEAIQYRRLAYLQ